MHNEHKRFAVVGCGSIGRRHARNLIALGAGEVIGVEPDPAQRAQARQELGIAVEESLDAVWPLSPDAVFVNVPTSLHIQVAFEAARRGVHVFIEKPLGHSLDGVPALLSALREKNVISLVGCNMRFQPGLMKIKSLLEDGAIGRVVGIHAEVGQYLPDWRPTQDYRKSYSARKDLGGGIILDAIHEIDYVRWLIGEVDAVACLAGKLSHLEIETEDTASILLRFRSGAIGEVHMDSVQRAYSRSCKVIGDEGTLEWDYSSGELKHYSAARKEWQVFSNPPGWQPNDMYLAELRHFLNCLSGDEKPALDAFDAARVLELALAAKDSAASLTFARV